MKKLVFLKIIFPLLSILIVVSMSVTFLAGILGGITGTSSDCTTEIVGPASTEAGIFSGDGSIDAFVREHKDAYILSWKAGGFLPSASITQTMIENGFNFTNPNGTSFWMAHNMGGVKTSSLSNFPVTIATYGANSVDLTGTKPGANVGDGTGGAYTWFSSYDAGIVGKAEFMAHQTLYTAAINNIDGVSTLSAIADGGWATDGAYKTKLVEMYATLGQKYSWLDKEAIATHGDKPYKGGIAHSVGEAISTSQKDDCSDGSSGGAADGTGIVPADATAWGYVPDALTDSLKQKEFVSLDNHLTRDHVLDYLYNHFEFDENTLLITNSDGGHGYTPYVFKEIAKVLNIKRHEHFWDGYHLNQRLKSFFKPYSEELLDRAFQAIKQHDKKKLRTVLDTTEALLMGEEEQEVFESFKRKLLNNFQYTKPAELRGFSNAGIGIMESQHRKITYRMKKRGMYWTIRGAETMSQMIVLNYENQLRELFFGSWREDYKKIVEVEHLSAGKISAKLNKVKKEYVPHQLRKGHYQNKR